MDRPCDVTSALNAKIWIQDWKELSPQHFITTGYTLIDALLEMATIFLMTSLKRVCACVCVCSHLDKRRHISAEGFRVCWETTQMLKTITNTDTRFYSTCVTFLMTTKVKATTTSGMKKVIHIDCTATLTALSKDVAAH